MADFDVSVRGGYRDVGGLVLDCSAGDYVVRDGRVARWRNRAPQLPVGESHSRFGDPAVSEAFAAQRPLAQADGAARFVRAQSTTLIAPSTGGDGAHSRAYAFAFEYAKGADVAGDQAVLSFDNASAFGVWRFKSGDATVTTATTAAGFTGDMGDAGRVSVVDFRRSPLTRVDWYVDGTAAMTNGLSDPIWVNPDNAQALVLGATTGGNFLDGDLYSVRAWRKPLSPRERDLVFADLAVSGASSSVQARCRVEVRPWRDGTGTPSLRQFDRLRPLPGEPHTYRLALLPAGGARVQFGCENGGVSLEDSLLGGELYSASVVERAGPVTFEQDPEWSSVFDVLLTTPGHYALQFSRLNHGGRIVHLDVAR